MKTGFVVWITGLPASGKSTVARILVRIVREKHNLSIVHLESDNLRKIFTPRPTYSSIEREWFYSVLSYLARLLSESGVHVLIDATGNRRVYRDEARSVTARFLEVYVRCPLAVCTSRDPKGIYRRAREGAASSVPGLQEPYEEPLNPDVVVESDQTTPEKAAELILEKIMNLDWFN